MTDISNAESATSPATGSKNEGGLNVLIGAASRVAQRIAVGLLASRGHATTTVACGSELTSVLADQSFDVFLLELELPECDVMALVSSIRDKEDAQRARIVGVVVSDEVELREQCLSGGMDALISVPFRPEQLYDAIERAADCGDGEPVMDWKAAVEQMQGREDMLLELVETFEIECETLMGAIRESFADADARRLQRAAHTLKGAASMFCADATAATARTIEFLAKEDKIEEAKQAWPRLQEQVARLAPALAERRQK